MIDLGYYKKAIENRLQELSLRMHEIDAELDEVKPKDLEEQAVDLEDDEVLEGLGFAAQKEVALLKQASARIKDGSFGICLECGEPISDDRLKAVLYAPLCKTCAIPRQG